ncbi:MAG: aldolase [Ramlibacter sp.]
MSAPSFPASQGHLREEICRVGRSLFERGLAHSTAGNLSVRLPQGEGFLITPTDACLGFLDPARLAWVGTDGTQLGGERASKTLTLHRRIYDHASGAGCVLHTHSTHLVTLTLRGVWKQESILPPITPYQVMKVGRIPLIPYLRPGDPRMADAVQALVQQAPLRGVLHERLGPTVWAADPASAMALLEELEETARLWLMTEPRPAPLSPEQLAELASAFGTHW